MPVGNLIMHLIYSYRIITKRYFFYIGAFEMYNRKHYKSETLENPKTPFDYFENYSRYSYSPTISNPPLTLA